MLINPPTIPSVVVTPTVIRDAITPLRKALSAGIIDEDNMDLDTEDLLERFSDFPDSMKLFQGKLIDMTGDFDYRSEKDVRYTQYYSYPFGSGAIKILAFTQLKFTSDVFDTFTNDYLYWSVEFESGTSSYRIKFYTYDETTNSFVYADTQTDVISPGAPAYQLKDIKTGGSIVVGSVVVYSALPEILLTTDNMHEHKVDVSPKVVDADTGDYLYAETAHPKIFLGKFSQLAYLANEKHYIQRSYNYQMSYSYDDFKAAYTKEAEIQEGILNKEMMLREQKRYTEEYYKYKKNTDEPPPKPQEWNTEMLLVTTREFIIDRPEGFDIESFNIRGLSSTNNKEETSTVLTPDFSFRAYIIDSETPKIKIEFMFDRGFTTDKQTYILLTGEIDVLFSGRI